MYYHGHEGPSTSSRCAGLKTGDVIYWPYHLSGGICIFLVIVTVIADVLMINLLKNLKKTQPIQLVPWKSTKNNETEKSTILIPVRATSLSLAITVITIFTVALYPRMFRSFENVHWLFYIHLQIIKMIIIPFMLVFTIKHSKNSKPAPIIPNRPMFHDSEVDKGMILNKYI